jgi:ABC-type Fe3+/spermidine/putrescine transport system ATPase subunit
MKVGVRPHDTAIVHDIDDVSDCYIEGTVKGTMFAGEDQVVTVQTDIGEFTAETNLSVDQGETMLVTFSQEDVHVFATGEPDEH